MTAHDRLTLILDSQTHATAASALRHLHMGNTDFAHELTEVACALELISNAVRNEGLIERLADETRAARDVDVADDGLPFHNDHVEGAFDSRCPRCRVDSADANRFRCLDCHAVGSHFPSCPAAESEA
jgi:hypothetical protein